MKSRFLLKLGRLKMFDPKAAFDLRPNLSAPLIGEALLVSRDGRRRGDAIETSNRVNSTRLGRGEARLVEPESLSRLRVVAGQSGPRLLVGRMPAGSAEEQDQLEFLRRVGVLDAA